MKSILPALSILAMFQLSPTQAQTPTWWGDRQILNDAEQNNKGPATIGQAKNIVKQAITIIRQKSPELAGRVDSKVLALLGPNGLNVPPVPSDQWYQSQKAVLLNGQLKALAKPFYDELHQISSEWLANERSRLETNIAGSIYPWSESSDDDSSFSPATIGQLKACFALDLGALQIAFVDSDGDGLSDELEEQLGLDPAEEDSDGNGVSDGDEDADGDGFTNAVEVRDGTDPTLSGSNSGAARFEVVYQNKSFARNIETFFPFPQYDSEDIEDKTAIVGYKTEKLTRTVKVISGSPPAFARSQGTRTETFDAIYVNRFNPTVTHTGAGASEGIFIGLSRPEVEIEATKKEITFISRNSSPTTWEVEITIKSELSNPITRSELVALGNGQFNTVGWENVFDYQLVYGLGSDWPRADTFWAERGVSYDYFGHTAYGIADSRIKIRWLPGTPVAKRYPITVIRGIFDANSAPLGEAEGENELSGSNYPPQVELAWDGKAGESSFINLKILDFPMAYGPLRPSYEYVNSRLVLLPGD